MLCRRPPSCLAAAVGPRGMLVLGGDVGKGGSDACAAPGLDAAAFHYAPGTSHGRVWMGEEADVAGQVLIRWSRVEEHFWGHVGASVQQSRLSASLAEALLARASAASTASYEVGGGDGQYALRAVWVFGGLLSQVTGSVEAMKGELESLGDTGVGRVLARRLGGSASPLADSCELWSLSVQAPGSVSVLEHSSSAGCVADSVTGRWPLSRHSGHMTFHASTRDGGGGALFLFGGACSQCTVQAALQGGLERHQFRTRGSSAGLVLGDLWRGSVERGRPVTWALLRAVGASAAWPAPRSMGMQVATSRSRLLLVSGAQCAPGCVDLDDVWAAEVTGDGVVWSQERSLTPGQCAMIDAAACAGAACAECREVQRVLGAVSSDSFDVGGFGEHAVACAAAALREGRVQRKWHCLTPVCRERLAVQSWLRRSVCRLDGGRVALGRHQGSLAAHPLAGQEWASPPASGAEVCLLQASRAVAVVGGESFAPYVTMNQTLWVGLGSGLPWLQPCSWDVWRLGLAVGFGCCVCGAAVLAARALASARRRKWR